MNICVTGGSGFIGSYIVHRLQREPNLRIWATTRSVPQCATNSNKVKWLKGELNSIDFCRDLVADKDIIIHLAHTSFPLSSEDDLPQSLAINILPTTVLLQAILESKQKPHLILASSGGSVYGNPLTDRPFTEEDPCRPVCLHGIEKLMVEHYIRLWARRGLLTSSVLRIANAFGTLLNPERNQGLIGIAMNRILAGQSLSVKGDLSNVRDYIYLSDVFAAFKACLERREPFEIFNIGSGKGHTVTEVISLIERVTGHSARLVYEKRNTQGSLVSWNVIDPRKAMRELGWKPKVTVEQGISIMYQEWLNENQKVDQKTNDSGNAL